MVGEPFDTLRAPPVVVGEPVEPNIYVSEGDFIMRINNVLSTILGNVKNVYTAALVAAGLIAGISLLGACANPAGDDGNDKKNITEPEFVAVTGITGVTGTEVPPEFAINLSVAQAQPDTATNKTIVWSIVNDAEEIPAELIAEQEIDTDTLLSEEGEGVEAGEGAVFGEDEDADGNLIKNVIPNAEGTLVLKAAIADGLAAGTAYTQLFVFTVVDGVPPPVIDPTDPTNPTDPTDPTNPPSSPSPSVPVAITSLAIALDSQTITTLPLEVVDTKQLTAVITPDNATNQDIIWSSNASSVVSIDTSGSITAESEGQAEITAKNIVNNKTAVVTVTVVYAKGVYDTATGEKLSGLAGDDGMTDIKSALTWIKDSGATNGEYTIVLADSEDIPETYYLGTYNIVGGTNSHTGAHTNLKITLKSASENTTVTLRKTNAGALFLIYGFNTNDVPVLILDRGITLQGYEYNNYALVCVGGNDANKKANFKMLDGSRITGNTLVAPPGDAPASNPNSGVLILANSVFDMEGGEIDHNDCTMVNGNGGGVRLNGKSNNPAIFNMSGGKIYDNKASNGGGVCIASFETFDMSGGEIFNNQSSGGNGGGGVFCAGNFNMSGTALIKGNHSASAGGGVSFTGGATKFFNMSGGTIEGNTAKDYGSAIYKNSGKFYKTGGTIYGAGTGASANKPSTDCVDINTNHVIQIGNSNSYYYDATLGTENNFTSTDNSSYSTP